MKCIEKLIDTIEYKRNLKRLDALLQKEGALLCALDEESTRLFWHYTNAFDRIVNERIAYRRKYCPNMLKDPE